MEKSSRSKQLTIKQTLSRAKKEIKQGNTAVALQLYNAVLKHQPNHPVAKKRLRNLEKTLPHSQALQTEPENPSQDQIYGLTNLYQTGQLLHAERVCRELLQSFPRSLVLLNILGVALCGQGKFQEAVAVYKKAIQLKPDYADAFCNLGNALKELGRLKEAVQNFGKAIQVKPDFEEAYNNRGAALKDLGQLQEAVASYDKAIQLKPDYIEAYNNRGLALKDLGQLQEAVANYKKAIQLRPDLPEAYSNHGNALKDLGRLDEAVENFGMAIQIRPDYTDAYNNLLLILNYTTNHNAIDRIAIARKFGEMVTEKANTHFSTHQCLSTSKGLRVGLVSGDLRLHPVGHFLEGILSSIDSSKIDLFAYPTTLVFDVLSKRIRPFFSSWKPIYGHTDEAVANLIHTDGINILLDLSGHTAHSRLPVFAYKPSPVQVSWLGYFATTGLNEMDYILGDPHVTPQEHDGQFTEKIWRLPETRWCFTPPSADVDVSSPPALNCGYITFGCFNNLTKVNDKVMKLWAKVLDAIPDSRLLLKTKQFSDQLVRESTIQQFSTLGIDSKRITLEESEDHQKYLAAYNRVDIALDPFPFTGGGDKC